MKQILKFTVMILGALMLLPTLGNSTEKNLKFLENQGQLKNEKNEKAKHVLFYSQSGNQGYYLQKDRISFVTQVSDNVVVSASKDSLLSGSQAVRVDMEWLGGNPDPMIVAEVLAPYKTHIIKGVEGGYADLRNAEVIRYKDVYPGIDLLIHSVNSKFKYDFIIHAGADPKDIQLRFGGLNFNDNSYTDSAFLSTTPLGNFINGVPFTFQNLEGGKRDTVACSYQISQNNIVSFDIGRYDGSEVLIIDPTVEWALLFGGNKDDISTGIAMDSEKNRYVTGYSASTSFTSTLGLSSVSGSTDAYIMKFDAQGNLVWNMLFGGDAEDKSHDIGVDNNDNIYITGYTVEAPSNGFPITDNTWIYSGSGGLGVEDVFVAKFTSAGILEWSIPYGGSETHEMAHGLCIDKDNNVLITGGLNANGIEGYNALPSCFLHTTIYDQGLTVSGGEWDIFVIKFSSTGDRLWATIFGEDYDQPDEFEVGRGVATDESGNVYVVASCFQADHVLVSDHYSSWLSNVNTNEAGTFATYPDDYSDILLVKFDEDGIYQWLRQYGSDLDDWGADVVVNDAGEILFTGATATESSTDFHCTNPDYYNGDDESFHPFVIKVNASNTLQWSAITDVFIPGYPSNAESYAIACTENRIGICGYADVGHHNDEFINPNTWLDHTSNLYPAPVENDEIFLHTFYDEGSDIELDETYIYGTATYGYYVNRPYEFASDLLFDECNIAIAANSVVTRHSTELQFSAAFFYVTDDQYTETPTYNTFFESAIIDFRSDYCDDTPKVGCEDCLSNFAPFIEKSYVLSAWVKQVELAGPVGPLNNYTAPQIKINLLPGSSTLGPYTASGPIIDGWQRIDREFIIPSGTQRIQLVLINNSAEKDVYFDDIRIYPSDGNMKSFVYDPETLRLVAEMDENNYATRYEYDLEGKLIRIKKDTERGIQTIQETNSNMAK